MTKSVPAPTLSLKHHHFHSPWRRGFYSFAGITAVLTLGTVGMHVLEGFSYLDAFYFTSMIATGQGPPPTLSAATNAGKIFTSIMAFVSVGTVVACFGFIFGPFMGQLWKIGVTKLEEEIYHHHPHP